ncbi:MAG TPA: ABC transporter ATP-binding protein, partial [Thermopetrobacter sp.]|nr:ABC transporter ATP-binding protein [Thermopetrobacter sp.]
AAGTEAPLLSITEATVTTCDGGRVVLDGVSLRLHRGRIVGLVGESGAGKTTLGLLALGHLRPGLRLAGGRVRFDGLDLFALPEKQLQALRTARLGMVAQSAAAAFDPAMRLGRQAWEAAIAHGLADMAMARLRLESEYRLLGLPDPPSMAQRWPHQVSGGQLQRAMAAMAMFNGPDLVILDEPTSALDAATTTRVLAAIRARLRLSSAAALFISHDLELVAGIADVIVIMRHGRIVEEGPTRHILTAPRHPYTRALWAPQKALPRPRPAGEALLVAEGLRAGYGRGPDVLHEVSFTLQRARTLAIVGRSGCGKSTLARVVCGLLPPRAGRLLLDGAPLPSRLSARSREELRRIQLVHQAADLSLNPAHDVATVLSRPLKLFHGLSGAALRERMRELLAQVELGAEILRAPVTRLSGGQKQRVAIARALAAAPDVLVCDEITSALDALVRMRLVELLRRLQRRHELSLLFITHDLALVRHIADRVAVMDEGRIVEEGTAEEVLQHPASPAARQLVENLLTPPRTPAELRAEATAGENAEASGRGP